VSQREYLPGLPPPKLVKAVRRHLRLYGIAPKFQPWRLAWEWANAIRLSYSDPRWPMAWEIGTQYVVLLLSEMKGDHALKLPYRATSHAPLAIRAALRLPEPAAALPLVRAVAKAALPAASPSLVDFVE
jgi:hypothetical protein